MKLDKTKAKRHITNALIDYWEDAQEEIINKVKKAIDKLVEENPESEHYGYVNATELHKELGWIEE